MAIGDTSVSFSTLLVIGIIALFVITAVVQSRRRARHNEELTREASMRGWQLEVVRRGHVLRGSSRGIPWSYEVVWNRGRRSPDTAARWHSDAGRLDRGAIEIWPAGQVQAAFTAQFNPQNPLIKLMVLPLLRALGTTMADANVLLDVQPVEAPASLAEQRIVRATNPAAGAAFLESGGERAMAAWAAVPAAPQLILAIAWHRGVDLLLQVRGLDLNAVDAISRLGTDLVDASRRASDQRRDEILTGA